MASTGILFRDDFIVGLMPDRDQPFSNDWSRIPNR
jgi:hypothetical protein